MNRRSSRRRIKSYGWLGEAGAHSVPQSNPKPSVGPLTAEGFAVGQYLSFERGPKQGVPDGAPAMCLSMKITNKSITQSGNATFSYTPTEDSIHPAPLAFDPPLAQFGKADATGFRLYWEKLNFVFSLPDPFDFPILPVPPDGRIRLTRFVTLARRMAKFSIINVNTALSISKPSIGNFDIKVFDPPSDESFLGASAAFRQLHNDGESASFSNCQRIMFEVLNALPDQERTELEPVLRAWGSARRKLTNHTIQTLVTMKATNATLDNPISYRNIKPDQLIKQFNYGDSLHFDIEGDLADLLSDDHYEAYYAYGALISILGLSHLYFGYAVLLDQALGGHLLLD